jgi:mono/diheme cytochrome c family protein
MGFVKVLFFVICVVWPFRAMAQDRNFTLRAPAQIVETGFMAHLLPRFSLKHGVRITLVESGGDVAISVNGVPVFAGLDSVWHITASDAAGPMLFTDWLLSDIGKRTIAGFKPEGEALFNTELPVAIATPEIALDGDPTRGERVSLTQCGRCHVINDSNKMDGMGQTPSFALMRTFDDWESRYTTFYVLNPHPSFTQVEDITSPFAANLPPAIVPIEITQAELEDIVAYVATIEPADLGAPLQSQ